MNQLLTSIQNLSNPVKFGIAAVGGGGFVGALALLKWNPTAIAVVIAGLALVALLLVLYRQVLKLLAKRKAAPMAQALSSNSAAAPQGISDPARRARLDDLRKNFENGVEKFRAAGKNLYSLPWYLLVGEPGSGKTEAVRHCNVGFPPGLQDQLQGVGGTINMNWWFTNHAVILDTAGRLMFEEVEPGSTNEWQEFLKLLRKTRPNCPVNGMLLVIPAESLIKDTADAIERKGGKIAQQLDQIQRALGVRFPVFVVITKCDLINGFREFFDDMKDPQLQHQILGWSNPAPLDEPFNAEQIEQHLASVQKRLVRRRLGLLLDPVHTEDPSARRTDEVDALFAFPEALMKIAPRLRRYLEMIFVAGVWSAKPLFLRGIYFTSSMREGSALDADLAEALGMPVESLPEGRVWERDRAYFLRDLFVSKVFREKGLVTRAVNTKAQQRQRRTVLLAAAGVGAVALAAFTYFGSRGLDRDIVAPKEFWEQAGAAYARGGVPNIIDEDAGAYLWPIVSPQGANSEVFSYDGGVTTGFDEFERVAAERRRLARFPEQLREGAVAEVPVPWVFLPVALVTGDARLNLAESERRDAARVLVEASVVRPLVDAAAERIRIETAKGQPWTPQATEALAQLIRLEVARATGKAPEGGVSITPLLAYAVMSRDASAPYSKEDAESLEKVVSWLYGDAGAGLPPPATGPLLEWVKTGSGSFTGAWNPERPGSGPLARVLALRDALVEFRDLEAELLRIAAQHAGTRNYDGALEDWGPRFAALSEVASRVDAAFEALGDRSLVQAYREDLEKFRASAESSHAMLLKELEPIKPAEGERESDRTAALRPLRELRERIEGNLAKVKADGEKAAEIRAQMAELDALLVGKTAAGEPAYRARFAAYSAVNEQLSEGGAQSLALGGFGPRFEEVAKAIDDARTRAAAKLAGGAAGDGATPLARRIEEAKGLCNFGLDVAARRWQKALLLRLVAVAPDSADRFGEEVAVYARANKLSLPRPVIPLTRAARDGKTEFEPQYSPGAAAALLLDIVRAGEAAAERAGEPPVLDTPQLRDQFRRIQQAANEYRSRFVAYWREGHLDELEIAETEWSKIAAELKAAPQGFAYNTPLKAIAEAMLTTARLTETVLPGEDVGAIRERAQSTLNTINQDFGKTCDRVLASWSGVAVLDLATDGRTRLLQAAQSGSFDENYVVSSTGSGGNFAAEFWGELCLQSVKALTAAAEQESKRAYERLRADAAFPLARPVDDRFMAPESVAAARASVKTILMRGAAGAGAPSALSKNAEFKTALERLGGQGLLTGEDRQWLERASAVLDALPEGDARTLQCRISILSGRPLGEGERPLEFDFQAFNIVQGSGPCTAALRLGRGEAGGAVPVSFPGEAVRFCFFTDAQRDTAGATREFAGPWAALRMLHELGATPVKESGNKVWEAKMDFPGDGGVKRVLWVQLEFSRAVPDLDKWPE